MNIPAAGHNRPPTHVDTAADTANQLGAFLTTNPKIDHTTAPAAAKLIDTTRRVLADLDDERRAKVDPLNAQVRDINDEYRPIRESVETLLTTVRSRLTKFTNDEERRRAAEAAEQRRIAEEAAAKARAAEEAERQAEIDSEFGSTVDIAHVTVEADQAFSDFKRADRQAARAERDVPVRLGTGMGRAVSMRTKETLHVDDWNAAISAVGMTDDIRDAILSAARAYRRLNKALPAGVRAETERAI